jgi:hypothetical protein
VDEATLRRLYATVPTEFVAARNDMVKELRRAKDRDAATLVSALRKPDWTDWALNHAAAERTDAVEEFASAAGDVRDAQTAAIEGRDGPDVRTALRTLRDRTADVIRAAAAALEGAGRAPGTAELTTRLSEIAANALACDQLRIGVLGSGDPDASDPFGGLEPVVRSRPRREAPSKRAAAAATAESAPPTQSKSSKPSKPSKAKPSAAELQRIKRERDGAARAHKSAVRDLAGAEAELEKSTVAVAIAREKLADAERRLVEATERRLAAVEKVAQAEASASTLDAIS